LSKISLEGNQLGSGTFTIASPNSNSNRTLNLPDSSGTVVVTGGAQTIEFAAGTVSAPSITTTGDTNTGIFFPAADTIAFSEGGTEAMRIDSSGNVGIGTTSPTSTYSSRLVSVAASGTAAMSLDAPSGTNSSINFYYNGSAKWTTQVLTTGEYRWYDFTSNTERARITSSGDLVVAKTSTNDSDNGFMFQPARDGAGNGRLTLTQSASTGAGVALSVYSSGASAYRFYVNMAGTVFATNTTISAISDQRYKENIRDLDVGLDAVMQLRPRKFDWKEGMGQDIKDARGFIAQEFEEVFPDLVDEWKDPAPDGEEPYKSVRQDLIPVLVKAIQELKAINDAQAQRIETLEANNAALEARITAIENGA
jgi:hypothetical protein